MRKTAITFGLVHIPVKYENAVQNNSISFNQLHKDTMERIRYKKSTDTISNVESKDIVKGYEYEKDRYIVMTDDDFEKIKTEKDKSIHIMRFTDIQEIDPIFFEKSYYLVPDGSDKAYTLLQQALERENKVALAKTVLSTNETLVAIRHMDGSLIMETMYYLEDLKQKPHITSSQKITEAELDMAITLIKAMSAPFQPEEFHDDYQQRLKAAIMEKINGNEITTPSVDDSFNVVDLMQALQASIEDMGGTVIKKKVGRPKKVKEPAGIS